MIDARTPRQLDAALRQLAGGLASPIPALRDRLADVLAHLEANLDFAEEPDVDLLGVEALARSLDEAAAEVDRLADRLRGRDRPGGPTPGRPRRPAQRGQEPAVQRLARPRPGDRLARRRDHSRLPRSPLRLRRPAVDLVDTAGLEEARGAIEGRAQAARGRPVRLADLLLDCRSADTPSRRGDRIHADRPRLPVWTKADASPPPDPTGWIATSASTGEGLDALRRAIADALRSRAIEGDLPAGTAARCGESLGQGRAVAREPPPRPSAEAEGDELVAVDLRQGLDDLGRVVGAVVTDDLLDRIFRRFCIGK